MMSRRRHIMLLHSPSVRMSMMISVCCCSVHNIGYNVEIFHDFKPTTLRYIQCAQLGMLHETVKLMPIAHHIHADFLPK